MQSCSIDLPVYYIQTGSNWHLSSSLPVCLFSLTVGMVFPARELCAIAWNLPCFSVNLCVSSSACPCKLLSHSRFKVLVILNDRGNKTPDAVIASTAVKSAIWEIKLRLAG